MSSVQDTMSQGRSSQDHPTPLSMPRVRDMGKAGVASKTMREEQLSSSGDNSTVNATVSGKEDTKVSCSICKETGYKWFKCSQRVCNICRETGLKLIKYAKVAKEDANLVILDQSGLVADDAKSKSCEFEKSNVFGVLGSRGCTVMY